MAVYTETIKLEDGVSAEAKKAAGEVAILTKSLDATNNALVKAKALGDIAVVGKLTKDAKALEAAISVLPSAVPAAIKPAAGAMGDLSKKTFDAANAIAVGKETISAAFTGIGNAAKSLAAGDVKGAVQGITDSIAGMAKLLDLVVPGLGQAVAAVIQIAGGLVGITAGLIKSGVLFAISSSEAKLAMLGLFDAMGGGVTTGAQVEDMIDGLKAKFGIAKDSLIGFTNELQRLGVTDLAELETGVLALASAAALVKGGDQALLGFTKKIELAKEAGIGLKIPTNALATLSATGVHVGDVAKVMGVSVEKLTKDLAAGTVDATKFGDALQTAIITKGKGPLERMAASSANLKKLLDEAWGDLFEDIDVGPFMAEIKKLFDIFGQGTESGKTLKSGIGGFFKEVFAVLTKVVPLAKHFLLDLVIYGLQAYIAIKPIVKAIKEFFASATGSALLSTVLSSLWTVLKVIGVVLAVVVGLVLALWLAMVTVSVAVWTVVGAIWGLIAGAGGALLGWVSGAATAAYDFVKGLVTGIANGVGMVIDAVKGLAGSALGAFKGALGIGSPSKIMMGLGLDMTDGATAGIEEGTADVQGASTGMATAAVKGATTPGAGAAGGGGAKAAGASINVQVQIDGAGKTAMEITEEMVSNVFARMALEAGV